MNKSFSLIILLFFFSSACLTIHPKNYESTLQESPRLLSFSPTLENNEEASQFEFCFSEELHPSILEEQTLIVTSENLDINQYSHLSSIEAAIERQVLHVISGRLSLNENHTCLLWEKLQQAPLTTVSFTLSSKIKSNALIPFNASPGRSMNLLILNYQFNHSNTQNAESQPTPVTVSSSEQSDPSASQTSSETRPAQASIPSLLINEVLYDAQGTESDGYQFIELLGEAHQSLRGIQVLHVNGSDGQILKIFNLDPQATTNEDGIYLIADTQNNSTTLSRVAHANWVTNFDLQNGPDSLQIIDQQGNLLDALCYGEGVQEHAENGLATGFGAAAPQVSAGHSLSRRNGLNTQNNQADFYDHPTPSPGVR